MDIFLAGTIIGLLIAVPTVYVLDDLRFVARHVLGAIVAAFGFGLSIPFDANSGTQNQLGLMILGGGVLLIMYWPKAKTEQEPEPKQDDIQDDTKNLVSLEHEE